MNTSYYIYSPSNGYWNEQKGWSPDVNSASLYTYNDTQTKTLPSRDSEWIDILI